MKMTMPTLFITGKSVDDIKSQGHGQLCFPGSAIRSGSRIIHGGGGGEGEALMGGRPLGDGTVWTGFCRFF